MTTTAREATIENIEKEIDLLEEVKAHILIG